MPAAYTLFLDPRTLKRARPYPPSAGGAPFADPSAFTRRAPHTRATRRARTPHAARRVPHAHQPLTDHAGSPASTADLPPLDDRSSPPGTSFRDRTKKTSSSASSRASSSGVGAAPKSASAAFWPFAETFAARGAAVHVPDLPGYVREGLEPRCWRELPREAVLLPLTSDGSALPACLLVLGLSSRRPYDAEYRAFIDLLRLSLSALLTAVQGREADGARAKQLAQLDEAKTTFFSNASHEFRTPLTLIQGPLLDCLQGVREPKMKERLEIAYRNAARLKRLVDSLLDFSKIAANRLEGRFRPLALGPYTADLASLFRSVIEKGHVEVRRAPACVRGGWLTRARVCSTSSTAARTSARSSMSTPSACRAIPSAW
jgi:hypothetical protein